MQESGIACTFTLTRAGKVGLKSETDRIGISQSEGVRRAIAFWLDGMERGREKEARARQQIALKTQREGEHASRGMGGNPGSAGSGHTGVESSAASQDRP